MKLSSHAGQRWLQSEIKETGAGLVVLDSRKDLGSTVDPTEVAGIARMVQLLVAADVEVLVLAHPVKGRRNGPPSLEDVSGLRDVFSGLGSVIYLDGSPGTTAVEVHQVKPIREIVPPFIIEHDHQAGLSERNGATVAVATPPKKSLQIQEAILATIDAHPSGWTPAPDIREVLLSKGLGGRNLSRDLKSLLEEGVLEHNGERSTSAYRRVRAPRDDTNGT